MRKHIWIISSVVLVALVGLYSKAYNGPASGWVHDSFGGVLYVLFWSLVVYSVLNGVRAWKIVTSVLVVTSLLELLQLYRNPYLDAVRNTFLGRALLGSSFSAMDYPYYVTGSLIGWCWIRLIEKTKVQRDAERQDVQVE